MSITLPYTFSNGTIADAAQVNANFDSLNNRTQWVTPEMFGAKGDVKFAGGEFSLTATINKSDALTLTYSSRDNCWYEISRAMNQ